MIKTNQEVSAMKKPVMTESMSTTGGTNLCGSHKRWSTDQLDYPN